MNRRYAPPGDTVYVGGFGYLLCLSYGAGHAIRLGGIGRVYRRYGRATQSAMTERDNCEAANVTTSSATILAVSPTLLK